MNKIIFKQIKNNKLAHSYLLISDNSQLSFSWFEELKKQLAITIADILVISREDQIQIEDIRKLQKQIKLKPHSSSYKLFFIHNTDFLRKEAANALLKTLEEPVGSSIIVLSATSPDKLLPTIISRCQIVRLNSGAENQDKINSQVAKELKTIKNMKIYEKFNYVKGLIKKEDLNNWLENLIYFFKKDINLEKNRIILKKLLESQRLLTETNANKQLIMENLFLEI